MSREDVEAVFGLLFLAVLIILATPNPLKPLLSSVLDQVVNKVFPLEEEWSLDEVQEFVKLLNEERSKLGLSNVSLATWLKDFAEVRWRHVAEYLLKTGKLKHYKFFEDRARFNLTYVRVGECCALHYTYPIPFSVLEGFKESSKHWRILMHRGVKYIYVICREVRDRGYLVVIVVADH